MLCFLVQKTCPADQFLCGNGSMCIPRMWLCDEQNDCPNNADEADCSKLLDCKKSFSIFKMNISYLHPHYYLVLPFAEQVTCASDEFRCRNGKCITQRWMCDQDDDCGDHSDEDGCRKYSKVQSKKNI